MEEYKDIGNDATDAYNASTTTTMGHKGTLYQALQHQLKGEAKKNQSAITGVLKANSGNAIKRLKIKQDAQVATWASKNTKAVIKQMEA